METLKCNFTFNGLSFNFVISDEGTYTVGTSSECDFGVDFGEHGKAFLSIHFERGNLRVIGKEDTGRKVLLLSKSNFEFDNSSDEISHGDLTLNLKYLNSKKEITLTNTKISNVLTEPEKSSKPRIPPVASKVSSGLQDNLGAISPEALVVPQESPGVPEVPSETIASVEASAQKFFVVGEDIEDYHFVEDYQIENVIKINGNGNSYRDFIDIDEEPEESVEDGTLNSIISSGQKAVEVIFSSCGNVIDIQHLDFRPNCVYFGNNFIQERLSALIPYNFRFTELALFKTNEERIEKIENDFFDDAQSLLDGTMALTFGVNQVSFKIVDAPPRILSNPLIQFNKKSFFPATVAVLVSVILYTITSLVIDIQNKTEEPIARPVIFRKKPEPIVKEVALNAEKEPQKEAPKTETLVKKEVKKKVEKVVKDSSKTQKQAVKKPKKIEKIADSSSKVKRSKKQKKSRSKAKKTRVKRAITKTYKFSSSKSLKSLFGKSSVSEFKSDSTFKGKIQADSGIEVASARKGRKIATGFSKSKISKKDFSQTDIGKKRLNKKTFTKVGVIKNISALGDIDPKVVEALLREHIPQFRHCYQRELMNNKISGTFDIHFTINGKGRSMKSVQVLARRKSFSNKGIGCISKVLGIIQFPKPKSGIPVDIKLPLNFVSQGKSF